MLNKERINPEFKPQYPITKEKKIQPTLTDLKECHL